MGSQYLLILDNGKLLEYKIPEKVDIKEELEKLGMKPLKKRLKKDTIAKIMLEMRILGFDTSYFSLRDRITKKTGEVNLSGISIDILPKSILDLKPVHLDLSRTRIKELPPFFANMKSLDSLVIPSCEPEIMEKNLEILSNLNLRCLIIEGSYYRGKYELPNNFNKLQSLHELRLINSNHLTSMPTNIQTLQNLRILEISNCDLKTIDVSQMNKLYELNLNNNKLVEFPKGFHLLQHLDSLDLSQNSIRFINTSIQFNPGITKLNLSKNELQQINPELYQLKYLTDLDLSHNNIKVLSNDIANLKQLKSLNITHTKINSLPDGILALRSLNALKVNQFVMSTLVYREFQSYQ